MRYKLFGRTGLRFSELALGTGTFGTGWGWGSDAAESRSMFDAYVEAGGNFLDCADVYQFGEAETILSDLIAADRDYFVLATKFFDGRWRERRPVAYRQQPKTDRLEVY